MFMVMNTWGYIYAANYKSSVQQITDMIEAQGGEWFAPILTKIRKRGNVKREYNYRPFGNIIFYTGVGLSRSIHIKRVYRGCIHSHEIDRIKALYNQGAYDTSRKEIAELIKRIGTQEVYNNPISPFDGQNVLITGIDCGELIGEIDCNNLGKIIVKI